MWLIFAKPLRWPQQSGRSETSRWCQETFPCGKWGCHVTCTRVDIVLPCHFLLSVKVCQNRNRQPVPAGVVSAIYPLPSYLCLCREATPHRVSIKVQRSADCPSSQIAHQLLSKSNSSSSVDGVEISEISQNKNLHSPGLLAHGQNTLLYSYLASGLQGRFPSYLCWLCVSLNDLCRCFHFHFIFS